MASRTGQVVASIRAGLDRPVSPHGDPDAQRKLCAGMPVIDSIRLREHIAGRTRFFDDAVLTAIAAGVRQIVICGAGYDDRALRFRDPAVRFFELDHPGTQHDKARRLAEIHATTDNPRLIAIDFSADDVAERLAAAGQRADEPSLFVCEGLLVYLAAPAIVRLLAGLAARATPDSSLVASLAVHADNIDSVAAVDWANAHRPNAEAEPWRTMLPEAGYLGLLNTAGWQLIDRDITQSRAYLATARPAR